MVEDIRHWLRLVRPVTHADDDWAASSESDEVLAEIHRRTRSVSRASRSVALGRLTGRRVWLPVSAIACATVVVAVASSGLTAGHSHKDAPLVNAPVNIAIHSASMLLSNYSSCPDLLNGLREHAAANVGPYGFPNSSPQFVTAVSASGEVSAGGIANAPKAAQAQSSAGDATASSTNDHEVDVDEPDIVKTTSTRIITVTNGTLRAIDRATQKITGTLDLTIYAGWEQAQLLLDNEHAVVILGQQFTPGFASPSGTVTSGRAIGVGPASATSNSISTYLYVDLTGQPKVTGSLRTSGAYLDARLIGQTVRLVVSSTPQIAFPGYKDSDSKSKAANQGTVGQAPLEAWLPQYTVTNGTQTDKFTVPCDQVAHPADYTGSSMLTVYTLDLDHLDVVQKPVSVAADGDTVYATKTSLYVASNPNWYCCADVIQTNGAQANTPQVKQNTEIHRFDITGSKQPTYIGSGQVPGRLLSQYSLSDYAGSLRLATTLGNFGTNQSSSVYVLDASTLTVTGHVDGLGKGEQIYAVRFIGPTAYVVTFRQTDPLYILDLSVVTAPKLVGELHMTGVSGYLHDAGGGRLIGVGQEASATGQTQGTQVSLFDVTKPGSPSRTGQVMLPNTQGEVNIDPHMFLYWQPTGLIAIPLQTWASDESGKVLVLKVSGSKLAQVGLLANPGTDTQNNPGVGIQRSLIVDNALWTLSPSGMRISDQASLTQKAWIPFT